MAKCVIFLLIFVYFVSESGALKNGDAGVCLVRISRMERVKGFYTVFTAKRCGRRRCTAKKIQYKPSKVYTETPLCCQGWQHNSEVDVCQPVCSTGCLNGTCIAPSTCKCEPPLTFDEKRGICTEPPCTSPCVNAECVQGKCECINNTRRYNETHCAPCDQNYTINADLTCTPQCDDPCVNGTCTAPGVCSCFDGYNRINSTCEPLCLNCVNSVCTSPGKCTCLPGFTVVNDTNCVPECEDCDNGDCVKGECVCKEGYDRLESSCVPVCRNGCVNGNCSAPDTCTCFEGYEKNASNSNECLKSCEPHCGGVCDEDGECPGVACTPIFTTDW